MKTSISIFLSLMSFGLPAGDLSDAGVDPNRLMCAEPLIRSSEPDIASSPVYVRTLPTSSATALGVGEFLNPNKVIIDFPVLNIGEFLGSRAIRSVLAELNERTVKSTSETVRQKKVEGETFTLEWPLLLSNVRLQILATYKIFREPELHAEAVELLWKVSGALAQPMPAPKLYSGDALILELSDGKIISSVLKEGDLRVFDNARKPIKIWSYIPGDVLNEYQSLNENLIKSSTLGRLSRRVLIPILCGVVGAVTALSFLRNNSSEAQSRALSIEALIKQNHELKNQLEQYSEMRIRGQGQHKIIRVEFTSDGKILFHGDNPNSQNFSLEDVIELKTRDGRTYKIDD